METVKHTLEVILDFNEVAVQHVINAKEDTKLVYALKRFVGDPSSRSKGRLNPILKEYQLKVADLMIDHASVDEKTKILLKDPKGNYEYTKESRKELNRKLDELLTIEYEVEPYYATEVDQESLTDAEKRAFKDFVIK